MLNARVAEFAEETLIGKVAIRKVVALSLYQGLATQDWRVHLPTMPGYYMISCFDGFYNIYVYVMCRRRTQEYIVPNPLYWYPGGEVEGSPATDARDS